jgi:predicted secreted protein
MTIGLIRCTLLLFLVSTAACARTAGTAARPDSAAAPSTDASVRDPQAPIRARPGEEFTLRFSSNPSTGYRWGLLQEPDARVVVYVRRRYVPSPGSEDRVGSGGTDEWTFRAVAAGEATLMLGYFPPSGSARGPSPRHTVRVEVR